MRCKSLLSQATVEKVVKKLFKLTCYKFKWFNMYFIMQVDVYISSKFTNDIIRLQFIINIGDGDV